MRVEAGAEADAASAEGLWLEERLLTHEGENRRLVKQVRYRGRETNEIVRVDDEQMVLRRRIR